MNVERSLADKVGRVAATGTDQDRARIQGEVARSRWGMNEVEPVNPSVDGNTPSKKTDVMPKYAAPENDHFAAARKLDLSVEAINRARDDGLYTEKRYLIRSLAYRLANPDVPLGEIAQQGRLQLEVFEEDLKKAGEAFQWVTDVLGPNNHPKGQIKD